MIGNVGIHANETVGLMMLRRHRRKRRLRHFQTVRLAVIVQTVRLRQVVLQIVERVRLGKGVVDDNVARFKLLFRHGNVFLGAVRACYGDDRRPPQSRVDGRDSVRSAKVASIFIVDVVDDLVFVLLQNGPVRDPLAGGFRQRDALSHGRRLAGFADAPPRLRHLLDGQNVAFLELTTTR